MPEKVKEISKRILILAGSLLLAGPLTAQSTHQPSASDRRPAVRRITLEEAEQQAAEAEKKIMGRLGELQVEAAKQHRLGAESDYFPKLSASVFNFHFNKFLGEEFTVQRPTAGGTATLAIPLAGKDQTLVATTAAQPITPLFKLHQVVNLARADEETARVKAKAGLPPDTPASGYIKQGRRTILRTPGSAAAAGQGPGQSPGGLRAGNWWRVVHRRRCPPAATQTNWSKSRTPFNSWQCQGLADK